MGCELRVLRISCNTEGSPHPQGVSRNNREFLRIGVGAGGRRDIKNLELGTQNSSLDPRSPHLLDQGNLTKDPLLFIVYILTIFVQ